MKTNIVSIDNAFVWQCRRYLLKITHLKHGEVAVLLIGKVIIAVKQLDHVKTTTWSLRFKVPKMAGMAEQ